MHVALFILGAALAYVWWRLYVTNTDIRPTDTSNDEQIVHYIQPRVGEPIPRS